MEVKANDVISFMISPNSNNAWDAGKLSVAIEPTVTIDLKPGDDNKTVLADLESIDQGTDGWYFMEGTEVAKAMPLTNKSEDGSAYKSVKDEGLEMKKDYVHTGAKLSAIYKWVVKEDGKIDLSGSYVKFPHNDGNPSWPDGITLTIYQNEKEILKQKVEAKQGDGNDNIFDFNFEGMEVKANDVISFMISPNSNNAYDGGKLSVRISDVKDEEPAAEYKVSYAYDQEYPQEVMDTLPSDDQTYADGAEVTAKEPSSTTVEGEKDGKAGKWTFNGWDEEKKTIQAADVKFTGSWTFTADEEPAAEYKVSYAYDQEYPQEVMDTLPSDDQTYADGAEVTAKAPSAVSVAGKVNDENGTWDFQGWDAETKTVQAADVKFTGSWKFTRTNNTVLKDDFSGTQGKNGWYYGMCEYDGTNFEQLPYDAENNRYMNNGAKPELKADFVEPGVGRNAAYKWVAARDGKIKLSGEYVKFKNNEDPEATGTCFRIFVNGAQIEFFSQTRGNFAEERKVAIGYEFEVKMGDEIMVAIDAEGNDSCDGGRLSLTISAID